MFGSGIVHTNSGTSDKLPYLQRYLPDVPAGSAWKRRLLQKTYAPAGSVIAWHDFVSSNQHDVQLVDSAEVLYDPSGQLKHKVDPSLGAKVPRRHPKHSDAPGIQNLQHKSLKKSNTRKPT
jgi:hypothetical protein